MENGELLRRDPPKPDESFPGYIIRLTEANGYETPSWILDMAGIKDTSNKYPFLFVDGLDLNPLSKLIGVVSAELKELTYPPAGGGEPNSHLAFRSIVPRLMIRLHHARVCPTCLAKTEYAHRIWELAPVTACPHHERLLLETCPACKRQISWARKTLASCACGYRWCATDCQPVGMAELRLTRLIHARCGLSANLVVGSGSRDGNNPLYGLDLQQLIQVVSFVARKLHETGRVGRSFPLALVAEKMQDVLSKAFDVFDFWPDNFNKFLDHLRETGNGSSDTGGLYGSFGDFYPWLFKGRLSSPVYDFMRKAFDDYLATRWDGGQINPKHERRLPNAYRNGKYVGKNESARELGISTEQVDVLFAKGFLKGIALKRSKNNIFLIERSGLEDLRKRKNSLLTARQAKKLLDLSKVTFTSLITHGCLAPLANPFRDGQRAFDKEAIEDLLMKIANRIVITKNRSCLAMVKFHRAIQSLGFSGISAGEFVCEILDGKIKPHVKGSGEGLSQFLFDKEELSRYHRDRLRKKRGDFLSKSDSARALGVNDGNIKALVDLGIFHIGVRPPGQPGVTELFEKKEIDGFKKEYVSGQEIAEKYGTSSWCLRRLLVSNGVAPAFGRRSHKNLKDFYRRSELEPLNIRALVAAAPPVSQVMRKRKSRLLNSEKAANFLAVPEERLRKLVRAGEINPWLLKGREIGRGVPLRYCKFDLERYKQRHSDSRELVSAHEAALLLGEDLSWFYKKWVRTGRLPTIEFNDKLGKHFFRRSEVEKMAELKKSTVTGPEAARILGMHRTAVLKLTKKGMLKPVSGPDNDGFGCNLYLLRDVEKLREERRSRALCA